MKGLKRAVLEAMLEHLKAGKTILVAGEIEEDDFDHSINIQAWSSIMVVKREKEKDTYASISVWSFIVIPICL